MEIKQHLNNILHEFWEQNDVHRDLTFVFSENFPSDNDVCVIKIKISIIDTLEYLKNLDWNNNMET